tara:strand:- start:28 stop:447 length:420 start_codon:yes stop_codon:yes gene_type:complete
MSLLFQFISLVTVMKLHHINIAAPAVMLEETKTFYCDILGLKAGSRPKLKTPGYWLYGESGPIVHLSESDIHTGSDRKHYLDHIAFSDRNLSNRLQLLNEAGLDYKIRKIEEEEMTQIFLYDPCGHKIELNFSELLSDN